MLKDIRDRAVQHNARMASANEKWMRQKRTLHVGNVPNAVDGATLLTLFQPYGSIEDLRAAGLARHRSRYWFVQFEHRSEAQEALRVDGTQVEGTQIRVSFAKETKPETHTNGDAARNNLHPNERGKRRGRSSKDCEKISRTIFVEGIEIACTALEIAMFFSYCGSVTAVRRSPVKKDPYKNRVWVEFKTPLEATIALSCNGQYFDQYLMAIQRSETAICTNELIQPIRCVYDSGVYHEVHRRSVYRALRCELGLCTRRPYLSPFLVDTCTCRTAQLPYGCF